MEIDPTHFYLPLVVTVCVAAGGWIAAHWFTSLRDRKNAERTARLNALSEAYYAFVRSGIAGSFTKKDYDGNLLPVAQDVERAVATVHLYGTPRQSELANEYTSELQDQQHSNATALVDSLREYIRSSLGLAELSETPHYARIDVFKNDTREPESKAP